MRVRLKYISILISKFGDINVELQRLPHKDLSSDVQYLWGICPACWPGPWCVVVAFRFSARSSHPQVLVLKSTPALTIPYTPFRPPSLYWDRCASSQQEALK